MAKRGASEDEIQIAVMADLIDAQARGMPIVALHIPNEGRRSFQAGKLAKAKGLRSGAPDIVVLYGPSGHALAIELKPGDGQASANQMGFQVALNGLGVPSYLITAFDGDDAKAQIWPLIHAALAGRPIMPEMFDGPTALPKWLKST
jgi:hypothetical protein